MMRPVEHKNVADNASVYEAAYLEQQQLEHFELVYIAASIN